LCTCYNGYTGDPFRYCHIIPPQRNILYLHFRKTFFLNFNKSFFIYPYRSRSTASLSMYTISVWTK
jgi:hypothetical protein